MTRWLTQQTLKRCTAVSVRDQTSARLLDQWKIPYILAPDPVWVLTGQKTNLQQDLIPPLVAVNLRRHSSLTPDRLETLITALVQFQQATQTSFLLIPFQMSRI